MPDHTPSAATSPAPGSGGNKAESLSQDARLIAVESERIITDLLAEIDYFRVRMMVAVSFLDPDTLDTFHEHVAEIDAKHRAGTYGR